MTSLAYELSQFTGTENYYRLTPFPKTYMTDGTKYLADKAKCYWLMELIASEQRRLNKYEFQTWTLKVENHKGRLTGTDGNGRVILSQVIEYTDFPMSEIELYLCLTEDCYNDTARVIMLPSEY